METKKYMKEDAYKSLELINSWISNVDSKASFALALITVILGFCFSGDLPQAFVEFNKAEDKTFMIWFEFVLVVILLLYGTVTLIVILSVLFAKTKNDTGKKSVLFFGTISQTPLNDYKSKTMNLSETDLVKDLLEQVHTNSQICTRKFKRYNVGMRMLIILLICEITFFACGLI